MKNWNLIFRRTHLYLGLLLIPWVLIYALSTFVFNHAESFRPYRAADPLWRPLWEKDYAIDAPAGDNPESLRATARRLLADQGIGGAFAVRRQGQRLNLNVPNFWYPKRLTYDFGTKKLRAEEKSFALIEVLIRLHERTGYGSCSHARIDAIVIDDPPVDLDQARCVPFPPEQRRPGQPAFPPKTPSRRILPTRR